MVMVMVMVILGQILMWVMVNRWRRREERKPTLLFLLRNMFFPYRLSSRSICWSFPARKFIFHPVPVCEDLFGNLSSIVCFVALVREVFRNPSHRNPLPLYCGNLEQLWCWAEVTTTSTAPHCMS